MHIGPKYEMTEDRNSCMP